MSKKQLKQIAKQLAELESLRAKASTKEERKSIESKIMKISESIEDFNDIFLLDELVLKFLSKS